MNKDLPTLLIDHLKTVRHKVLSHTTQCHIGCKGEPTLRLSRGQSQAWLNYAEAKQ
ncbi:MAG: hypothetical protein IIX59_00520 [Alistipes sp.]|nr:hypothetical protein [Alistipes sp.]